MRGITRYIEDLARSRRPRGFRASTGDGDLARVAITLRAARPGSGAPAEDFVTALHKKLAAELEPPAPRRAGGARRAFLRAAATLAAVVTGGGIDRVLQASGPAGAPAGGTLRPTPGAWLAMALSADIPDGTVQGFTACAVACFVERLDGQLRAVSAICTHQGCRLTLAADRGRLACPCHGAEFALDGAVLSHPLHLPLAALPQVEVREANGVVEVFAPASCASPPAGGGPHDGP